MMSMRDGSLSTSCSARSRSLACTTPTMFSGSPCHSGNRVYWLWRISRTSSCGLLSGVDRVHVGAVDHDVGHFQLVQVEDAADPVAVVFHERPFPVQHLHRAAHLLARGQQELAARQADAGQTKQTAHKPVHAARQRPEHKNEQADGTRYRERKPVGIGDRPGFRQHLGEDDQEHRHDQRGVGDARLAEQRQEHRSGERRRQDVDQVVSDEQRADQPVAPGDQPGDHAGAAVSGNLERKHAGP